jgi:hypothetical protein
VIRAAAPWVCAGLAGLLGNPAAQASPLTADADAATSVLVSQLHLVQGDAAIETTLTAPSAGVLSVSLTDLQFPTSFASLQFALTDATSTVVGLRDAGTMSIDLTAPTTLYADVFAASAAGYGLFNLSASFEGSSPVPLPGGAVSLASGCLLLLWFSLRAHWLVPQVWTRGARR